MRGTGLAGTLTAQRCGMAWGVLPLAVNEYWQGSQGRCPYANCGEPYSFVRDPSQPPPFSSTDGGLTWIRNFCPNPYDDNTCQGPYDNGAGNFGRAFALMGQDATPNYGSMSPRGAVELDYRYDALADGGDWHYLVADDTWQHNVTLPPDGVGKAAMMEVILAGGYGKVPISGALHEPPFEYIDQWGYCWDTPSPDTCFNYPELDRQPPYDVEMFLSGTSAVYLVKVMYDNGDYVDGRYAPGQRIIVAVYNGFPGTHWGSGGAYSDAAVVVGYFRAVIVGYGNAMTYPCSGTPGDWQSFTQCVTGSPTTVYGLAESPLILDPSQLFPPPNRAPAAPAGPVPADGATAVVLTTTLSWDPAADPDGDTVTYDVALGTVSPPPLLITGAVTPSFDPGPLLSRTTYYWSVTARDCLTGTAGLPWSFTTGGNRAPGAPYAPNPPHGKLGVPLDPTLSWQCADADGDPLTYLVALGTSSPPPVVAAVTDPQYKPGQLSLGTFYYWSIAASDGEATTAGPAWCFLTVGPSNLPLLCSPSTLGPPPAPAGLKGGGSPATP